MDAHFVPQYGTNANDEDTRRTIRRHVMLGKNTGKTRKPKQPTQKGFAIFHKDDSIRQRNRNQQSMPRRLGSDLSFLSFADTVDPVLMGQTLQFCMTSDEKMFALEPCIAFDSAKHASACVQLLADDALHLHVIVYGAQSYMNHVFRQATSQPRASPHRALSRHYGQALSLLRGRLTDISQQSSEISEIVLVAITSLAMSALASGDIVSAERHVLGLSKLFNMNRPYILSFLRSPKHLLELLRCDILVSLATGKPQMFFPDHLHDQYFPLPQLGEGHRIKEFPLQINSDRLANIWNALTHFCDQVNRAVADQQKLSDGLLLDTTAPVMYGLMYENFALDSFDEITRLALLSFCVSTLLSWNHLQMPVSWLQREYRQAIHNLMLSCDGPSVPGGPSDPAIQLWHAITYATSFYPSPADAQGEPGSWLAKALRSSQITDWAAAKTLLTRFPWINTVCDAGAQKVVEVTLASYPAIRV